MQMRFMYGMRVYKSGKMLLTNDEVCKGWGEYFRELIGDDSIRDVAVGTIGLKVRGEQNRYMREKDKGESEKRNSAPMEVKS